MSFKKIKAILIGRIYILNRIFLRHLTNSKLFKRDYFIILDKLKDENMELVDNFVFFLYLLNKNQNAYYMVRKNNKFIDFNKYNKNLIIVRTNRFLSFKFYFLLLKTKYILDSYQVLSSYGISNILCDSKINFIYTQHGINFFKTHYIKNSLVVGDEHFNSICFSMFGEELLFSHFNYPKERMIFNGLFRWENINPNKERLVFIFFSHRGYVKNFSNPLKSRYFLSIMEIYEKLKQNGVNVKIAFHHVLKETFNVINCDFIKQEEISLIKQQASLLITDYSSMAFDFMIYDKPVVFYDPDANLLCLDIESINEKKHFNSIKNRLYNITTSIDEAIEKVFEYHNNNYELEEKFKIINKSIFINKTNICDNFYKILLKLNDPDPFLAVATPSKLTLPFTGVTNEFRVVGLSTKEVSGRWSCSDQVAFYFNFDRYLDYDLKFNLHSIRKMKVSIFINDVYYSKRIIRNKSKIKYQLDFKITKNTLIKNEGKLKLILKINTPLRPLDLGINKDKRFLALFFKQIIIKGYE
ncbi:MULTISPECIES: CDP-glycerol glycerophosphotransferase family protein [unclassified Campylobacter]|uniref:CDP-glycerol glycerophosphotransferase family protein n=1 Tax=unclassified Campylobacter TaxID=2593542 RepID=UPI001DA37CAC|nr:CDP-glycerol glycerophosphotransferase family protein [Campylobacter sp. RM9331]MBZ8005875.1 CDP-glycerol glycerophosphotransferase family protein [Campylobacter sp. RM9332]